MTTVVAARRQHRLAAAGRSAGRSSTTRIVRVAGHVAAPRAPGEQRRDLRRELAHVDRLLQVAVEAGRQEPLPVVLHRERGQRDRRGMLGRRRVGPQPRERLDPVHARQLHVHQDQVGTVRARQLDAQPRRRPPRASRSRRGSSTSRTSFRLLLVVLDDQDQRRRSSRLARPRAAARARQARDEVDELGRPNVALLGEVADLAGEPLAGRRRSCPSTSARRSARRPSADRRAAARRPRSRRRRASADRAARRAGRSLRARARTPSSPPVAAQHARSPPARAPPRPGRGRPGRRRSRPRCARRPRGAAQRAERGEQIWLRSTGLTRYSAAPSANPLPRSSIIETITTGIAAVAGSALSRASRSQPSSRGSRMSRMIAPRLERARASSRPLDAVAATSTA